MSIENTYFGKGIVISGGFDLQAKVPLDTRARVPNYASLETLEINNAAYEGIIVYVEENKKTYQYIKQEDNSFVWVEFGNIYIIDNLESEEINKALSANQGKILNNKIKELNNVLRDILVAIEEGTTASNKVEAIQEIIVNYFEDNNIPVEEVEN